MIAILEFKYNHNVKGFADFSSNFQLFKDPKVSEVQEVQNIKKVKRSPKKLSLHFVTQLFKCFEDTEFYNKTFENSSIKFLYQGSDK